MPTKIEKDQLTGKETTGHEWDGIRELNTPLPKWWVYVFYATIVWALIYFVLYPAIPLGSTYTKGLLGWSSRDQLNEQVTEARARQAEYLNGIRDSSFEEIVADPTLFAFAQQGGRTAFMDNCAACHGAGGQGNQGGYPVLADDAWLWGGTMDAIYTTLLHGIRWDEDPQTRFNMMPVYGDFMSPAEIDNVSAYVLSLSGGEVPADADLAAGEEIFTINCVACHGDNGEGIADLGAPNLTDAIWLYGGTYDEIVAQIHNPKHGVMPAWGGRLEDEVIKMVTIYVHSLGGGQ